MSCGWRVWLAAAGSVRSRAGPVISPGSARRPAGISVAGKRRACGSSPVPALSRVRDGPGARAAAVIPVPGSPAAGGAGELGRGARAGGVAGPGGGPGQARRAGQGEDAAVAGGAHRAAARLAGQVPATLSSRQARLAAALV